MPSKRQIALIHALTARLGMDDDTYRALLSSRYGAASSTELDRAQTNDLIDDLRSRAGDPPRPAQKQRPRNLDAGDRAPALRKIDALLQLGGLTWAYADGIARQMGLADRVQWVAPQDLPKIISALMYQGKRRGWVR